MAQPAGRHRAVSIARRVVAAQLSLGLWAGLLAGLMTLVAIPAAAAGSVSSGAYTLQYSAVNSMQIPPEVARANGIERSGDTALIMVTLHRPAPDKPLNAVPAEVSGYARDLMGNRTALRFDRVEAVGSVYSLAQIPIEDDQTVTVELEVSPVEGAALIPVTFTQTFFTREGG